MNIDQKDIEQYLSEVKDAVEKDNYRLDRNARRQENINLFLDYIIDEARAKEIILSLTVTDFRKSCRMNIRDMSSKSCMYSARMWFFWRGTEQKKKRR